MQFRKKREMHNIGIVLLYNNACSHFAGETQTMIQQFQKEYFDYPPYSLDLTPFDYSLQMKRELCCKHFESKKPTFVSMKKVAYRKAGNQL